MGILKSMNDIDDDEFLSAEKIELVGPPDDPPSPENTGTGSNAENLTIVELLGIDSSSEIIIGCHGPRPSHTHTSIKHMRFNVPRTEKALDLIESMRDNPDRNGLTYRLKFKLTKGGKVVYHTLKGKLTSYGTNLASYNSESITYLFDVKVRVHIPMYGRTRRSY